MKNIAIWASGTGSNAKKIIDYFINHKQIRVSLLISNKPNIPFNNLSSDYDIPLLLLNSFDFYKSEILLENIKKYNIELHVLAGFLWKIPQYFIQENENKIINIHPALLPKYGGKGMYGMHIHKAVFENNENESGITIHYVNKNYDEGNVILQHSINIENTSSPAEIQENILKLEHQFFAPTIEKLLL
jgi:phosphoribosylglycinamide formyltransferase-1